MAKVWLYRLLAAVGSVAVAAIAGVKSGNFGAFAAIVAGAQIALLTVLGNLVKKWGGASAA